VEYNIAYGKPGATREQVDEAARVARIHNFISATPKGYDTMVDERGDCPHAAEKPAHPDL
jgi:ATP-binding cassette subfamily B protein